MPIHDWGRISEGTFHYFRQRWVQALAESFNRGGLPPDYFAMTERAEYGVGTSDYANRGDRVTLHQTESEVVSAIDIVSPGNKRTAAAVADFTRSIQGMMRRGVHLLVIDLFHPSRWDRHGIHSAIWETFGDGPFASVEGVKPFTLASYSAGPNPAAYVENAGVGEALPDMPLFLTEDRYIPCLLERTSHETWNVCPPHLRTRIENPPAS